MENMISAGIAWLSSQLETAAGEDCVYVAGDEQISITATPAKPQAVVDGMGAALIDADALDFLIDPSVLVFAAGLTTVAEGHKIKRWPYGVELTYEVRRMGSSLPCCEPHDAYGTRVRVHTKLVDSE